VLIVAKGLFEFASLKVRVPSFLPKLTEYLVGKGRPLTQCVRANGDHDIGPHVLEALVGQLQHGSPLRVVFTTRG
jgi:hypothetical protein